VKHSFTDELLHAIDTDDFSTVFASTDVVMLNYLDAAINPNQTGTTLIEVLCLLLPADDAMGLFNPQINHSFRSRELPKISAEKSPNETCLRLIPEPAFFGTFTPAVPLPSFLDSTGTKESDYLRQTWRWSRSTELKGFGQPDRQGCALSVPRSALTIPPQFKLAWLFWVDDQIAALVDDQNNRML
jgi:hypothetical protein